MSTAENNNFKPSDKKIWLATSTIHGEELKYMTEAFETNCMRTVGEKTSLNALPPKKLKWSMRLDCFLYCCTAFLYEICRRETIRQAGNYSL